MFCESALPYLSLIHIYRARWAGFGWHAIVVDGHDIGALVAAFEEAARTKGRPTVLLAKTFKGRGISFMENHPEWHGKPMKKGEETQKALDELTRQLKPGSTQPQIPTPTAVKAAAPAKGTMAPPPYKLGDSAATREAFGAALLALSLIHI